jgi:hypothetical protein
MLLKGECDFRMQVLFLILAEKVMKFIQIENTALKCEKCKIPETYNHPLIFCRCSQLHEQVVLFHLRQFQDNGL